MGKRDKVKAKDIAYMREDLAEIFGVTVDTIDYRRRKGRIPPPDFHQGRTPYWNRKTITRLLKTGIVI